MLLKPWSLWPFRLSFTNSGTRLDYTVSDIDGNNLFFSFGEWAKRVSVALAMLDLLDELDSVLDDPVHLCDVKPDHFGISDVGRVKFLDLDSVYLRTNLGK